MLHNIRKRLGSLAEVVIPLEETEKHDVDELDPVKTFSGNGKHRCFRINLY